MRLGWLAHIRHYYGRWSAVSLGLQPAPPICRPADLESLPRALRRRHAACAPIAWHRAHGSIQRRRVLDRRDAARAGSRHSSPGHTAGTGASRLARLPRVRHQLPDDWRRVACPHRADRSARAGRSGSAATQLAALAGGGVPAVPDPARRRRPAPRRQRARVCHDVWAGSTGNPPPRLRPGRLRQTRAPLLTVGSGAKSSRTNRENSCPHSAAT
jgi:hypothetical protein